ncbi:MAG: hypothetical protein CMI29_11205 [Opitutae bacterium]|nr:hypothetical protein [Opitutae bacterium]|tara:strand:+ start:5934 stop:6779 length:846 start_codon:yes stop_codon:yes gene_type:complete
MSEAQSIEDIEVEEKEIPNFSEVVNYNPLADNVEEKEYQKVSIEGAGRLPDIEEPIFSPPTIEDIRPEMFEGGADDEDEIFGKERLNDLPKGDKKKAAKQMTEMVLEGYSSICSFAGGFANMNEGQLLQMQTEGKIDLRMAVPVSPQEAVGVVDFVQSFNTQIDEAMEVSDEFKESVKEPMTRVFEKKGLGMTDEQFLLVMFGKDIITKTATTLALKKQLSRTLELVHEQYKDAGSPSPPPPVETPPPPPPRAENSAPENRRERRKKVKKSNKAKIVAPND